MCIPSTMFLIGSGMQAGGQLGAGLQARSLANWEAAQIEADAEARAGKIRKAGRFQQGEARAGFAGSGVAVDTGTPALVDQTIGENVEEDALTELFFGKRKAAAVRASGKAALVSSLIGAGGSILSAGATYNALKGGWVQKPAPIEERKLYDPSAQGYSRTVRIR